MTGLLLGSSSYAIAWAAGLSPLWSGVIGGVVAAVCWFGRWAVNAAEEAADDLF